MSASILLWGNDSKLKGENSFSRLLRCQLDTEKDLLRTTWEMMGELRNNVFILRAGVPAVKGGEGWLELASAPGTLTHHGEGPDAGLHGALVLLLQPRTLEQPCAGLQQLHHNGLVCLQEATRLLLQPGPPSTLGSPGSRDQGPLRMGMMEEQGFQ